MILQRVRTYREAAILTISLLTPQTHHGSLVLSTRKSGTVCVDQASGKDGCVLAPRGYFRNFWVRMCRCNRGTLNLYQSCFSCILLPCTRVNPPNHSYPRVAVFQKLTSLAQSSQNKTLHHNRFSLKKRFIFLLFSFFKKTFNQVVSFVKNGTLF